MDVPTILAQARDSMTVQRVFGEPIEREGVTIIPVAVIRGGGGGGEGSSPVRDGAQTATGGGAGFWLVASPLGVYIIKGGHVRWQPAFDLNRFLLVIPVVALGLTRLAFGMQRRRALKVRQMLR